MADFDRTEQAVLDLAWGWRKHADCIRSEWHGFSQGEYDTDADRLDSCADEIEELIIPDVTDRAIYAVNRRAQEGAERIRAREAGSYYRTDAAELLDQCADDLEEALYPSDEGRA